VELGSDRFPTPLPTPISNTSDALDVPGNSMFGYAKRAKRAAGRVLFNAEYLATWTCEAGQRCRMRNQAATMSRAIPTRMIELVFTGMWKSFKPLPLPQGATHLSMARAADGRRQ